MTPERLQHLHDRYLELIRVELDEFGTRPTDLRHLIARLGELHAALQLAGDLVAALEPPGFQVLDPQGRRISVKTTTQLNGFVSIAGSTIEQSDDLMVVHYHNGRLDTIYHGPVENAKAAARFYAPSKSYELDVATAQKLAGHAANGS